MIREIIHIDEEKCTGCGLCVPNCPEGAIQMIDDKARVISDLFCDGLGACIGHCPEDAITIEKREALPYDERKVMENIVKQGKNVIKAHLEHLEEHGEHGYLSQAKTFLKEKGIDVTPEKSETLVSEDTGDGAEFSELTHWPIQLHLTPAMAPHFEGKDILLSADCVAYSFGNFHSKFLSGKMLAIACPKLDHDQEIYRDKITALIDHANINTLSVLTMEVPCCRGLLMLAQEAAQKASRKIPLKSIVVSVKGEILSEEWA
jgi:ferredoxin